jgi:hypothetical protein
MASRTRFLVGTVPSIGVSMILERYFPPLILSIFSLRSAIFLRPKIREKDVVDIKVEILHGDVGFVIGND